MATIESYCKKNLTRNIGAKGFSGSMLLQALHGTFPNFFNTSSLSSTVGSEMDSENSRDRCSEGGSGRGADVSVDNNVTSHRFKNFKSQDEKEIGKEKDEEKKRDDNEKIKELYSDDDLDLLALAFSAVKLAYLKGEFSTSHFLLTLIISIPFLFFPYRFPLCLRNPSYFTLF
jgi:hypothetical protein